MSEEELQRVWILRKLLHDMDDIAAIEFMIDKLKDVKTNEEFFNSMKGTLRRRCSSQAAANRPPDGRSLK